MVSGPEGGLSKRKRNRLDLRTALAALAIFNATPGDVHAQVPQTTAPSEADSESQKEHAEFAVQIRKAFEASKNWSRFQREHRAGSEELELEQRLSKTEPFIGDRRYLDGLKIARDRGVRYYKFLIESVDPEVIMDHAGLQARLNSIPGKLRPYIEIGTSDIAKEQDYHREGLQQLAEMTAALGQKMTTNNLNEMLDHDKQVPSFSAAIIDVSKKSEGALRLAEILDLVRNGSFSSISFTKSSFVSGALRLSQEKISLREVTSEERTDTTRATAEENISNPSFIDSIFSLKSLGYSTFRVLEWVPELYRNPLFLKNAESLKRTGNVGSYLDSYRSALLLPELGETLSLIPEARRMMVLRSVRESNGNIDVWNTLRGAIFKYAGNSEVLNAYISLDAAYLKDSDYMRAFDNIVTSPPQDEFSRLFQDDAFFSRLFHDTVLQVRVNRAYVREKLGIELKTLQGSLQQYLEQWDKADRNSALFKILDSGRATALRGPVLRMNQLHDGSADRRLEALRDLDSRTLFEVLTTGGADAYLSTFRLIYNGNGFAGPEAQNSFVARVQKEYGSLSAFLREVRPDHKKFGTFLELLSQNDVLDTFLSDVGSPEDQHTILREFLFDASSGITDTQALTFSDLLHTTKSDSIRDFVFGELRSVQGRQLNQKDRSPKIAGLLIADYFQGQITVPEWAHTSVQEYGKYFPEIQDLPGEKVFRTERGVERNIQVHLFYDDRMPGKSPSTWDGHHSFRSFITSLGGSVIWDKDGTIQRVTVGPGYEIKDEGNYITIRQVDSRTKREITMYANKPDRNDETVARMGSELIKKERPQIVVHRGHSYHVGKTIRLLEQNTAVVNLGSCGGAKNITDVLTKAPSAQVMATRGVGTMLVNDAIIPALNRALLRDGQVNWERFRNQMAAEFDRRGGQAKERWGSYQMPDKNRIAHLITALKAIEK